MFLSDTWLLINTLLPYMFNPLSFLSSCKQCIICNSLASFTTLSHFYALFLDDRPNTLLHSTPPSHLENQINLTHVFAFSKILNTMNFFETPSLPLTCNNRHRPSFNLCKNEEFCSIKSLHFHSLSPLPSFHRICLCFSKVILLVNFV